MKEKKISFTSKQTVDRSNFFSKIIKNELPFIFICPALLWQIVFLYIPLTVLFLHSFFLIIPKEGVFAFTLDHYKNIIQPFSLKILWNSFFLALKTSILCLLLAYPLAYFLVFKVKRFSTIFLLLVILPSWTSWVAQIYAWFFLLKKDGIITQVLYNFGFLSKPTHVLNNHFAVLLGMVYCYMPFMVLPIYSVMEKIDRNLLKASADLGATRWVTIKKIIFPLSLSGIVAGLFLVFIPAFGEFVIPEFLGGSKNMFWGNVIVSKFLDYRDWQSGSAATFTSLLFPIIVVFFFFVIIKLLKKLINLSAGRISSRKPQSNTMRGRDKNG